MSKSYWIKIGLRGLGVFLVGLLLLGAARRVVTAKGQIHSWADSLEQGSTSVALSLPVSIVPLYVNHIKVGKLDTVVVLRHEPETIDGLRIIAHLDAQSASRAEVDGCDFAIRSVERFDLQRSMVCADDTTGLVRFGKVVFPGAGLERPLYIRGDDIESLPWRYHAHGPDWDFDEGTRAVSLGIGDLGINVGEINIALDLQGLDIDLEELADELDDLADELEGLSIELNGTQLRIGNFDQLKHLDAHITSRLRERLKRLERLPRIEVKTP